VKIIEDVMGVVSVRVSQTQWKSIHLYFPLNTPVWLYGEVKVHPLPLSDQKDFHG